MQPGRSPARWARASSSAIGPDIGHRSSLPSNAPLNDWVLCLDADERVTSELRQEIEALRARGFPDHAGWSVPRITDYFGRFLRHGNAYPDRLIRLFDRRRGGWIGEEIHENTRVNGSVGRLTGHLEHFSYRSLTDHHNRMARYADLMARAFYARGKRCGLAKVLFNPLWRFFRGYVLRLGFLDGWRGLCFTSSRRITSAEVPGAVHAGPRHCEGAQRVRIQFSCSGLKPS